MKTFLVDAPPYVRTRDSVAGVYLTFTLGLIPAFALSVAQAGLQGLAFAASCLAGAAIVEGLSARLLRGASHASVLSSIYDGALFVVLTGSAPSPVAAAALAGALFFAKMIFGGVGRALFSPACLAWLLAATVPGGEPPIAAGVAVSGALAVGSGVLLWKRLVGWEEAAAFLAAVWISAAMRGASIGALALRSDWILAAFFLVPALGPRPLERRARALVALAAGLAAAAFEAQGMGPAGVPAAVLLANAAAPALNQWVEQWRAHLT